MLLAERVHNLATEKEELAEALKTRQEADKELRTEMASMRTELAAKCAALDDVSVEGLGKGVHTENKGQNEGAKEYTGQACEGLNPLKDAPLQLFSSHNVICVLCVVSLITLHALSRT